MCAARNNETQEELMKEVCIIIDKNDTALGSGSKEQCHLMSNINGTGLLHRAFSVFLFNTKGELLLQQRSADKITFPLCWTNTCCSHPLHFAAEMELENQIGVKRAAQRKLEHELGIPVGTITLDEIHFLTRIHYVAPYDAKWGEHEIDYILFVQKDVDLNVNSGEVAAVQYVSLPLMKEKLKEYAATNIPVSPWFALISDNFLYPWWQNLPQILAEHGLKDPSISQTIHRLGVQIECHTAAL